MMLWPHYALATALISSTALATQKVLVGGKENPLNSNIYKLAIEALEEWHVPGLSIAIVDGEDTWAAGYGNATLPSTPVTPSTLFYGGSTTKAFTAAIVSLLIDSGAYHPSLSWQTPISQLIRDDFVLQPEYAWAQEHLTLEDLLSHRTGFARHDKSLASHHHQGGDSSEEEGEEKASARSLARSLRHLPMVTEPRTTYRYCNLMYLVASHAIQTLTRTGLGALMRDWIWGPLGMHSTYFSLEEALAAPEHLAAGYYWDYDAGDGGFARVPYMGLREASGAGAVVSNVLDYARWVRCLVDEAAPLSRRGHGALRTPRIVPAGGAQGYDGEMSYALGWRVNTYKGHRVFTHSGGMEAYGADVWFFPELRYGIVTMGNTAVTSNFVGRMVAWRLINDRLGVPEEQRYDWHSQFEQSLEDLRGQFDKAEDKLYPDRAQPPLPRALPLEEYTGTYFHPAYRNLTIALSDAAEQLRAVRKDSVWKMTFDFGRVSGEFWVIYIDMLNTPNKLNGQLAKAEFVIGPSGKVDKLIVEFLEEGSEGIITFDKIM
ncbi:beta-lactamase/transpeptidase-like protein [Truncatella angustata]|uniref:Beta-lactamase/transpeptidase-like protein n=1 Tax=Truncatella angustata TaxID=152316 RepID=A0A9P8RQJ6_9PEZI|nr:beta-lactamase/transpeptidase-like protein [Truncatella angustata]KAH6647578.1 beta-lactamase/transpeptidase-like protein [Truncatella angustata]